MIHLNLFKSPASAFHLFLFTVLLLAGCGGPPSEGVGRKALQNQIQNQSNGKIKLVSFSKTNGKGSDSYYQLEYEAEIEFLATGAWDNGGSLVSSPTFGFSTHQIGASLTAQLLAAGSHDVREGQKEKIKGTLQFEKTENGWRGRDGQTY